MDSLHVMPKGVILADIEQSRPSICLSVRSLPSSEPTTLGAVLLSVCVAGRSVDGAPDRLKALATELD